MHHLNFFLVSLFLICSPAAQAADDSGAGSQSVRVGLVLNSGIPWLHVERGQEREGVGVSFGYGLYTEFRITDHVSLSTGLTQSNYTAGVKYEDDVYFSYQAIEQGEEQAPDTSLLISRSYLFSTIELPLLLKLKIAKVGYFTYFCELGFVGNVIYKSQTKKNQISVDGVNSDLSGSLDRIDANDVTNWFRGAVSVSAGFEWNFVGRTSLLVKANVADGLTNILKDDAADETDLTCLSGSVVKQKGTLNYFGLSVGLLF